jgi:hypothetical protein
MNTLEQIASAINNHILAGLKGATLQEPYSHEQLQDEILVERDAIIKQLSLSGTLQENELIQSINCLELDCQDLSLCCNVSSFNNTLHFKLPKPSQYVLNPIKFVGTVDREYVFNIVKGPTWKQQDYGKFTRTKPFVWFHPNLKDGFLFNPPTENIKYISVDFIPANPKDLEEFGCCKIDGETPSGIPNWMVSDIIGRMVNKYTQMYWRLHPRPNTQVSA